MKTNKNASVVSCPPCGENVAVATKRGAYKAFSLMSPSIGPADHFLRKGGRKGFTLIELLVVVLIIGILAAVAVPQYQLAVMKSRYIQLQTAVRSLKEAENVYFLTHGEHTLNLKELDIEIPSIPGYQFVIWMSDDKKTGVVTGIYKGLTYNESLFTTTRQCRANEDNQLANAVCISLGGQYVDTYESNKAYRLP